MSTCGITTGYRTHKVVAMNQKLYLVARADLEGGPKAVQTVHAVVEYAMEHPQACKDWYLKSNHIALLEAKDEKALERLVERAIVQGISFSRFYEPDLDNQLTAVVFGTEAKRLCRHLPLAYSEDGSCSLGDAHQPPSEKQVQG